MAIYEPRTWLLSLDFFCTFPTKASPRIQFCSFSLSFCPKMSNWRCQICLLPSTPLIYLHGKQGVLPGVRQCHGLYKASFSFFQVLRGPIFKLSFSLWISVWDNMTVPQYSCLSSFLFHPINGQATVTVFHILGEKKKSQSHFSM